MSPDVLIVGGGVIGLACALALRARGRTVTVLEKEPTWGAHASGRNSGVLHAGFYYSGDSLKARFCRDGNARMRAWCEARGVPVRACGKLVVARDEADHAGLDELLRRGIANGVRLEPVDEAQARDIDPRARTVGRALWSPTTASVDPLAVMREMAAECERQGVVLRPGVAYVAKTADGVRTTDGDVAAGVVLNCAGLQADVVARDFGFSRHHRILPFKGLYLYGDVPDGWLRTNVYPVPDLGMPFLGVHFTVTADGHAKIGPTALPAPWREAYGGLGGFKASELVDVVARETSMFLRDGAFRRLAATELRKAHRPTLLAQAARLVHGLEPSAWTRWGRPGIRAQLLDVRTGKLEMDFLVEGDERSVHVLNAVSPAFTCSLAFADEVVRSLIPRSDG